MPALYCYTCHCNIFVVLNTLYCNSIGNSIMYFWSMLWAKSAFAQITYYICDFHY
jgi:hypothetical protein